MSNGIQNIDILLTNDDSHVSPLLPFVIDYLQVLGNLIIVTPKEEQSGCGKSISCFRRLELDSIALNSSPAYTLTGTPADCVNIGIYHLCEKKPDLVVSGINIGMNASVAFMLSSGTIGACLEANVAGIPAIALSQDLDRSIFTYYTDIEDRKAPEPEIARLQQQTGLLLQHVFQKLLNDEEFWKFPVTWNINLPFRAVDNWKLVRTYGSHTTYGSWFKRSGNHFHHHLEDITADLRDNADDVIVKQGHVSMTRLDIRDLGKL